MKRSVLLLILSLCVTPAFSAKPRDPNRDRGVAAEKKTQPAIAAKAPEYKEAPMLVIGSVAQWQARAEDRYPELRTPDSPFCAAFRAAYEAMQRDRPEFLVTNDWPMRLAEIVARSVRVPRMEQVSRQSNASGRETASR